MCGGARRTDGHGHSCCQAGGQLPRFLQPWVLLLLLRKPGHGYELMERLAREDDLPDADPGLLYPMLRRMEQQGLVRSTWDTGGAGPARRLYQVTPEGVEYLHAWAVDIRKTRGRLDRFLEEYQAQFSNTGDEKDVR